MKTFPEIIKNKLLLHSSRLVIIVPLLFLFSVQIDARNKLFVFLVPLLIWLVSFLSDLYVHRYTILGVKSKNGYHIMIYYVCFKKFTERISDNYTVEFRFKLINSRGNITEGRLELFGLDRNIVVMGGVNEILNLYLNLLLVYKVELSNSSNSALEECVNYGDNEIELLVQRILKVCNEY